VGLDESEYVSLVLVPSSGCHAGSSVRTFRTPRVVVAAIRVVDAPVRVVDEALISQFAILGATVLPLPPHDVSGAMSVQTAAIDTDLSPVLRSLNVVSVREMTETRAMNYATTRNAAA
jgi:hypothetical protein